MAGDYSKFKQNVDLNTAMIKVLNRISSLEEKNYSTNQNFIGVGSYSDVGESIIESFCVSTEIRPVGDNSYSDADVSFAGIAYQLEHIGDKYYLKEEFAEAIYERDSDTCILYSVDKDGTTGNVYTEIRNVSQDDNGIYVELSVGIVESLFIYLATLDTLNGDMSNAINFLILSDGNYGEGTNIRARQNPSYFDSSDPVFLEPSIESDKINEVMPITSSTYRMKSVGSNTVNEYDYTGIRGYISTDKIKHTISELDNTKYEVINQSFILEGQIISSPEEYLYNDEMTIYIYKGSEFVDSCTNYSFTLDEVDGVSYGIVSINETSNNTILVNGTYNISMVYCYGINSITNLVYSYAKIKKEFTSTTYLLDRFMEINKNTGLARTVIVSE